MDCKRRSDNSAKTATDPQVQLITAFLSAPFMPDDKIDGLWIADKKDLQSMLAAKFLKEYDARKDVVPLDEIKKNLEAAKYFLRVNNIECDELFLVVGGQATAHPGEKKIQTGKVNTYDLTFSVMNTKTYEPFKVSATMSYDDKSDTLTMNQGGKPFRLYREKRSIEALVSEYAKPAVSVELPQY
ncbi:MAG TPA: hypothetical protein PLY93_10555 [Turneriella sp.]|nr:hypothetical protein [Turneriella sp.]